MVDDESAESGLFATAKDAQAVFNELLFDWPPVSLAEAKILSEAFALEKVEYIVTWTTLSNFRLNFFSPAQPNFPKWFRLNIKYVRGILYVADNGLVSSSETQDISTSFSIVVSCLLAPLVQILQLPVHEASKLLNEYVVLEEQRAVVVPECTFIQSHESEATIPDPDDFEFEPMTAAAEQLAISCDDSVTNFEEEICSWERVLSKITHIANEVTYIRVAQAWPPQDVGGLLLRLLQQLETFESSPSSMALAVKATLLLRDRILDAPADAAALLPPLLAILRPNPHTWSVAAGSSAVALALVTSFAATRPADTGAAEGVHDGSPDAVRHARDIWSGGGRAACDAVAARVEAWGTGGGDGRDENGEAEAGHVAQSLLLGGAGWAGEALLASGYIRLLSLRVLAQASAPPAPLPPPAGRRAFKRHLAADAGRTGATSAAHSQPGPFAAPAVSSGRAQGPGYAEEKGCWARHLGAGFV